MIGKIKALGLAFVAVVAMSAVAAGSAQAASALDVGTAGFPENAVLTAQDVAGQETVFTLKSTKGDAWPSRCVASLEATTAQGTIQEVTATPTYTGCRVFGLKLGAQLQMNGCKYTVTTTATALTGLIDITGCTAGKKIIIKGFNCTLEVGEQNGLSHVVFTNQPSNHVNIGMTLTGLAVTQVGAECPDGNGHVSTNLSLTGNTTLTALKDEGTTLNVTEHGHQFTKNKHGEPLTLVAT